MKKKIEILLLRLAIWVLLSRNVARSKDISRKDNNKLWVMAEQIESIIERMEGNYEDWVWDFKYSVYRRMFKGNNNSNP